MNIHKNARTTARSRGLIVDDRGWDIVSASFGWARRGVERPESDGGPNVLRPPFLGSKLGSSGGRSSPTQPDASQSP